MENQVCKKGYKNKPLTEEQKAGYRKESRMRSLLEHIFDFMDNPVHAETVSVGY
jgi:hypothetical protein